MPWTTPTETDVLNRFTPQEQAMIKNVQGALDMIPALLADRIASARGQILAGGYALDAPGTSNIPDQIKPELMDLVRWDLLTGLPGLDKLRTAARQQAAADAKKLLDAISRQKIRVESPTPPVNPPSGQWNSDNKLLIRTRPIPPPATQFQSEDNTAPPYANPTGPQDT